MLLIHTALYAEARTLITHFGLKRQHQEHAFACFSNQATWLIQSGTGKINTASAIGWLSAKVSADRPVWLNIGIAGHANHELGSLVLAHRVQDQISGHQWHPPMLVAPSLASGNLLTVEQSSSIYPDNAMLDMEASGFFTAACHFTDPRLIHSLKIIADNRQHPPTRMKPKDVDTLFGPHLNTVQRYTEELLKLRHNDVLPSSASQ